MKALRRRRKAVPVDHRTRAGLEKRARTRLRIIESALQVFAEKGLDVPVIDDFVKAAGIARGTYYNYYRSTSELLAAATQLLENDMIESIEAEIGSLEDPVVRLTTGVRLWLHKSAADPHWCGFTIRTYHRGHLVEKMLDADLRKGVRIGAFRIPSATAARDLVVGTILEAMRRFNTRSAPRSYADEVARIILTGLGLRRGGIDKVMRLPLPAMRRPARPHS